MKESVTVPYDKDLDGYAELYKGNWGVILAHGRRSKIDEGLLPALSKKLGDKGISSLRFNFPFKQVNTSTVDNLQELDKCYQEVWNWTIKEYPDKKWILGGHDIGGKTAIRVSGLVMNADYEIPHVVCISFPLYPPNQPDKMDASALGAVMGDILFVQPSDSNQGSFERLKNSTEMMVPHAMLSKIKNADHEMQVKGKSTERVAHWISNDIERFLTNRY